MEPFTILLAGPIHDTPALRTAIAGSRVVAADRGMVHAERLGLSPELWVGDFDSADPALAARFPAIARDTHPRDKDRTDGEIAIEAAIRQGGARQLLLVGALGGPRTDHAFAHLILALRYAEKGIAVELFDGRERALPLLPGTSRIAAVPGAPFSVLKFTDLEGLSISGARWPLADADIPFTSILTQSNEAAATEIEITLRRGRALVLLQASADPD